MDKHVATQQALARRGFTWALILLFWWTRLHNLDALPVFLDEGIHIHWARLVWSLQPFHAASDGKLLSIWLQAVFWPFVGTSWVARASTVMVATIGFAALLAFGRRLRPRLASTLACAIYVALPLTIFFDRMALVDAVSAAEVMLLIHMTALTLQSRSSGGGRVAGLILAITLLTKLTNIVFVIIPLAGAITLSKPGKRLAIWTRAALIYLYATALLLPAVAVLLYIGNSDLGIDLLTFKTGGADVGVLDSARKSFGSILAISWVMGTPGITIASLAGVGVALWRRKPLPLFLCSVLIVSVAALASRTGAGYLESRYLIVNAPLAALLAGQALALVFRGFVGSYARLGNGGGISVRILCALAVAALLWPGARFLDQAWNAPRDLQIPKNERWEYITGWPSGYGFREVALDYHAKGVPVQLATFDLGGWQRLRAYLPPGSSVTPVRISPDEFENGSTIDERMGPTFLVLDHPKDDEHLSFLTLSLTPIVTYRRPGNESRLTVYSIGS